VNDRSGDQLVARAVLVAPALRNAAPSSRCRHDIASIVGVEKMLFG
jgi:hypothetical protein